MNRPTPMPEEPKIWHCRRSDYWLDLDIDQVRCGTVPSEDIVCQGFIAVYPVFSLDACARV